MIKGVILLSRTQDGGTLPENTEISTGRVRGRTTTVLPPVRKGTVTSGLLGNLMWHSKRVTLEGEGEITKDAGVGVEGGLAQSISRLSSGFVW